MNMVKRDGKRGSITKAGVESQLKEDFAGACQEKDVKFHAIAHVEKGNVNKLVEKYVAEYDITDLVIGFSRKKLKHSLAEYVVQNVGVDITVVKGDNFNK
eukprot:TRINITY_DN3330_c0_g1_i1.p2 TRINITY_DN3330_c0_g1~~TRINITY_DN3330_c0_g1_i1.p2  ORF type:complete len:100 (+),score=24.07 TRINITY_DN3330_c0_g1_i1:173-472(+)